MADFFGTDKVEFDVVSGRSLNGVPIPPRHFERFSDAIKEVVDARVWGGIHFRTADEQGAEIGKKVAHWLDKHYFQPVRCKSFSLSSKCKHAFPPAKCEDVLPRVNWEDLFPFVNWEDLFPFVNWEHFFPPFKCKDDVGP